MKYYIVGGIIGLGVVALILVVQLQNKVNKLINDNNLKA